MSTSGGSRIWKAAGVKHDDSSSFAWDPQFPPSLSLQELDELLTDSSSRAKARDLLSPLGKYGRFLAALGMTRVGWPTLAAVEFPGNGK